MQTLTPPTAPPVESPPPSSSLWEDMVDVFVAPGELFARRRDGRFGAALLALTLVSVFLFYAVVQVLGPAFEAEFNRRMQASAAQGGPSPTPEQVAQMRTMGQYFLVAGTAVSVPAMALLTGAVIWLLGRGLGSGLSYGAAAAIATFSAYPSILMSLSMLLQGLVMEPRSLSAVSLGPARLADPETTPELLLALLGRFDLFALWGAALVAVGLMAAGRLPAGRAWGAAAVVWLLALVPSLLAGIF